jgi:ABC-type branched-subunit amino acid transport system substrate-binding protein
MTDRSWNSRGVVGVVLAVCAVLMAAACSSSGSSSSSSAAAATSSGGGSSAATGSAVTVLTIAPTNSPEGNHPEVYAAVQAAALAFNKAGGVKGHKVNVIYCNDSATATGAAQCAREAVSDHVVAVVGGQSVYGDSINPILQQAGIPNIGNSPIETSDFSSPISFPIDAGGLANFQGDVFALAKMGLSKVAVAVIDTPTAAPIVASLAAAIKTAKTPDGTPVKLVATVKIPITVSDFTPYSQTLKSAGAQGIIAVESPQQIEGLMKADQSLGNKFTYSCGANNFSTTDAQAIGQLGTMIGTLDMLPPTGDSTGAQEFRADMAAAQEAGVSNANDLSYTALASWEGMQAFKAAADTVPGALTSTSLLAAVRSAKDVNINDVLPGPWTPVDPSRPKVLSQLAYNEVYVTKLSSAGTWSLIYPQPLNVLKLLTG